MPEQTHFGLSLAATPHAGLLEGHDRVIVAAFSTHTKISDEKKHEEALERARRMRRAQQDETVTLGRTFARDADGANAFSKLSRYETAIERQLYRAQHEL